MRRLPRSARGRGRTGFTLIEMLVYLVLSVVVLGALYQVMIGQGRAYSKQREVLDVRESVRSASALLGWELRQATTAGRQLIRVTADSVRLLSTQGLGIICAKHATLPRYALWRTSGDIQGTADDSAAVYHSASSSWAAKGVRVSTVGTPASLGVTNCSWGAGGKTPDLGVELTVSATADTAGVVVGGSLRTFRAVTYGEYQDAGRWWLGRKVGGAGAVWEKLTGPLMAPSDSGLRFRYYDAAGNTTATPANVVRVEFLLRAQSRKQYYRSGGDVAYQIDSIRARVALRQ